MTRGARAICRCTHKRKCNMHQVKMITDRIEWHEGMLLSPQHFQQLSTRLDTLVAWQTLAAAPFGWGVRRLVLDQGLLSAGLVRVLELEAIMPDGTVLQYAAVNTVHGVLELPLQAYGEHLANEPLDIYVTLPVSGLSRGGAVSARFRSAGGIPVEDEVSEAEPVMVPRLLPNLSLSAGHIPPGTHTSLRIGTVYKENELFKLSDVLPPLMEVPPSSALWISVANLLGLLRGKAAFVAKQTAVPSSRVDDRLNQLELKDRLRNLLSGLPMAEAVLRTPHLHPLPLYWALCSLLGGLSLLRPGGVPAIPMDYNHNHLSSIFSPLLRTLGEAVSEVSQDYKELKFEFIQGAFELSLDPLWLQQGTQLVVGLRGSSDKDLTAWMNSAIVGAQSVYPLLRERRILGADRMQVDAAEEIGVRPGTGYLLYAVQLSTALTIAGEKLVIANANEGATAQRPQEMVLFVKG